MAEASPCAVDPAADLFSLPDIADFIKPIKQHQRVAAPEPALKKRLFDGLMMFCDPTCKIYGKGGEAVARFIPDKFTEWQIENLGRNRKRVEALSSFFHNSPLQNSRIELKQSKDTGRNEVIL